MTRFFAQAAATAALLASQSGAIAAGPEGLSPVDSHWTLVQQGAPAAQPPTTFTLSARGGAVSGSAAQANTPRPLAVSGQLNGDVLVLTSLDPNSGVRCTYTLQGAAKTTYVGQRSCNGVNAQVSLVRR